MKKTILFLAIFLTLNSCKGQEESKQKVITNKSHNKNMEHFDIEKYKDWELDSSGIGSDYDKYYKKGDKKVRIVFSTLENTASDNPSTIDETIQVEETDNTPYKIVKVYSYKTKKLLGRGVYFYQCSIGIDKEYDENGNFIKETNNETPYKLSVEGIIKIAKQEYNIDLMDTSMRYNFSRSDYEFAKYQIRIPLGETISRLIIIDATTGKTISDKQHDTDDKFRKNKETSKKMGYQYYHDNNIKIHQIYDGICYTNEEWEQFIKTKSWWWRKLNT